MLEDLTIKDYALIDSASVEFGKGFTVLSGETGAGKSILIGALSFLLGGRSDVDQIRSGADSAAVSGTFLLEPTTENFVQLSVDGDEPRSAVEWLEKHGIESDSGRVLLRRNIRSNGKSTAWIQSTPVTKNDLASFSSFLVDIHGQHDHQSLMRVPEHRHFLDSFAGITDSVISFSQLYKQLVDLRSQLSHLNSSESDRAQKQEILSFAVKEITDAKIKIGEDEELTAEETKLSSFEKLYECMESVNGTLSESDESIVVLLKRLRSEIEKAAGLDTSLQPLDSRFENAFYEMSDIAKEFRDYSQSLIFDPDRLAAVQDRLAFLFKLKKKYASSSSAPVGEVLAYCEKAQKQLTQLESNTADKQELARKISDLEHRVYAEAKKISHARRIASEKMAIGVENVLSKLGMSGTKFSVSVTEKPGTELEQKCSQYGMDDIEFLISANPGSPLMPLAKIASGGELSRVMLALKTVLAQSDPVQTMIFDEIDTGIGGEVAVAVGSHLKKLAVNRQILCITHLASIAVYADNQIKIEKNSDSDNTKTVVSPIEGEARVSEIARMLSGDQSSEESRKHARAMLEKYKYSGGA